MAKRAKVIPLKQPITFARSGAKHRNVGWDTPAVPRLFLPSLGNGTTARIESIDVGIALDPGSLGVIIGDWPGTYPGALVELPAQSTAEIERVSAHQFRLFKVKPTGSAPMPSLELAQRPYPAASLRLLAGGQSLAENLACGTAGYGLRTALLARYPPESLRDGIEIVLGASGGSSATSIGRPDHHWVTVSGNGDLQPSSLLDRIVQRVASLSPADQPQAIIWDQGQEDVRLFGQTSSYAQVWSDATSLILSTLRSAIVSAGGRENVPIFIVPIGRAGSLHLEVLNLRAAQASLARDLGNAHLCPVLENIPLKDSVHPTDPDGEFAYAEGIATAICAAGIDGVLAPLD